jgi:uncharacterized protein YbjQ (UPF0145 family)
MPAAKVGGKVVFEGLHLGPEHIASMAKHAQGGLADGIIDLRAKSAQVKKRNGHRMLLRTVT